MTCNAAAWDAAALSLWVPVGDTAWLIPLRLLRGAAALLDSTT